MRSSYASIFFALMLCSCATSAPDTAPVDNSKPVNAASEYLCEAYCTYSFRGAQRRINLAVRAKDHALAWQAVQNQCDEIRGLGTIKDTKSLGPLLATETRNSGSETEYGFRPADKQQDCVVVEIRKSQGFQR